MKSYGFLSLIAVLALTAPGVQAQIVGGDQEKRFEQMDRKIDEAQKLRGKARQAQIMEHMKMMSDQMQAMRPMMGSAPGAAGQMGPGRMGQGQMGQARMGPGQMGPGGAQMMRNRMDMLQKMMEQMQKHQELMLENDG